MYKIGIISDIHGNDIAFRHVLDYLHKKNVDEIINLGDYIAIGPNGNHVIEIATNEPNFTSVRGNHENYYCYGFHNPLSCTEKSHQDWVKAHIDTSFSSYLNNLPWYIKRDIEGHQCIFLHYARNNNAFKTLIHNPTADDLDTLFDDYESEIICYGHDHLASIIKGKKTYVNPGSCGCPHPTQNKTRGLILSFTKESISYEPFEIEYNPLEIINTINLLHMPDGDFIIESFYHYKKSRF